jgi:hypothetical protein
VCVQISLASERGTFVNIRGRDEHCNGFNFVSVDRDEISYACGVCLCQHRGSDGRMKNTA